MPACCPVCAEEVEVHQVAESTWRYAIHGDCPGGFADTTLATTDLESRYTVPSAECPHPERWHSDDWDSAEHEVSALVGAFVAALRPSLVVETGSAFGQTAECIGLALEQGAYGGVLHTIELSPERAEATRRRVKELPVVVEQMSSLDFVPPAPIGFAWLDSLLPLRVPEFRHFYDHFVPGAIVGFHDTAPHHGATLWSEIMAEENAERLLPIRLPTPRGVVFAEVVR